MKGLNFIRSKSSYSDFQWHVHFNNQVSDRIHSIVSFFNICFSYFGFDQDMLNMNPISTPSHHPYDMKSKICFYQLRNFTNLEVESRRFKFRHKRSTHLPSYISSHSSRTRLILLS